MFLKSLSKTSVLLLCGLILPTACSTAQFPEYTEEDELMVVPQNEDKIQQKTEDEEKILAAKTKPVFKSSVKEAIKEEKVKKAVEEDKILANEEEYFSVNLNSDKTDVDDLLLDVNVDKKVENEVLLAHDENMQKITSLPEPKENTKVELKEDKQEADLPQDIFVPSVSYKALTVYFDNGTDALSAENVREIKKVAKEAKTKDALVSVVGHSSSRTKNTDEATHKLVNFQLSWDRALNVAKIFKNAGVKDEKIIVEAASDKEPAYLEVMPEGERLNRRVEVYISY